MPYSYTRTRSPRVQRNFHVITERVNPKFVFALATSAEMQRESRPGSSSNRSLANGRSVLQWRRTPARFARPRRSAQSWVGLRRPWFSDQNQGGRVHATTTRVSADRCRVRAPWPSLGSLSKLMCLSRECWNGASKVSIAVNDRSRPPSRLAMLPDVGTGQPLGMATTSGGKGLHACGCQGCTRAGHWQCGLIRSIWSSMT